MLATLFRVYSTVCGNTGPVNVESLSLVVNSNLAVAPLYLLNVNAVVNGVAESVPKLISRSPNFCTCLIEVFTVPFQILLLYLPVIIGQQYVC